MREARLESLQRPVEVGREAGMDVGDLLEKLDGALPVLEAVVQTAGYLMLTAGAVWLLIRFVP